MSTEPKSKTETLNDAWSRFRHGDHLTDEEIKAMLKQANAGLEYLRARGTEFHLAIVPTIHDIMTLESYLRARKERL